MYWLHLHSRKPFTKLIDISSEKTVILMQLKCKCNYFIYGTNLQYVVTHILSFFFCVCVCVVVLGFSHHTVEICSAVLLKH